MSTTLQIEVRDTLAEITAAQWNALNDDGNPFLRYEFLHTLESTRCLGERTGWYPRYFLLWQLPDSAHGSAPGSESGHRSAEESADGSAPEPLPVPTDESAHELIGAVATYVKTNSYGEFVFDWAWADAYQRNNLEYYPKLVASIPFTPATGRRLLIRADQPMAECAQLLAAAIRQFADSEGYSGVHYLFITKSESEVLCGSEPEFTESTPSPDAPSSSATSTAADESQDSSSDRSAGGSIDEVDPNQQADDHLLRLDVQYHWQNDNYADFDDFLARCTSKRRKTIRRERRYVSDANLRLEQRLGSSLSEREWRWVHQFYCATFDRKWGKPSLTRDFFETIGEALGDQVLIVFAYDPEDAEPEWPVACSVMFIGRTTLYGRYWGCRAEYNALHFEACYYQGIDYCIANRIDSFEPGAQGEHKITRGFIPTYTRSAHFIHNPQFREAIANYLEQEKLHVEQRCEGLNDLLPFRHEALSV